MANSASDAGKSEYAIRKKMIEEGVISQMVTLPSNMFSSVTLPVTLWFFDKHKPQTDKKDEILFIDARGVFTQVDRAHRKFSDEQIKNLGIITKLYQGHTEAFHALIKEYKTEVMQRISTFLDILSSLAGYSFYFDADGKEVYDKPRMRSCAPKILQFDYDILNELTANVVTQLKEHIAAQNEEITYASLDLHFEQYYSKNQDKQIKEYDALIDRGHTLTSEIIYYLDNMLWLLERFPDGVYRDVIGLCKVAKLDGEDGIIDQDYSLNAGRYVGVVIEDDGMTEAEFKETMLGLHAEFERLNAEAKRLEVEIAKNMEELFHQ